MTRIVEADCSVGGPFDAVTVRDETPQESAERGHICDQHLARRQREQEALADRQDARDQIASIAVNDPDAPLPAGLVARALGL
jgi:hypothetical protein